MPGLVLGRKQLNAEWLTQRNATLTPPLIPRSLPSARAKALTILTVALTLSRDVVGGLAGAGGIEPPNGGIKIRLIIQRFQRAFGKNGQNTL